MLLRQIQDHSFLIYTVSNQSESDARNREIISYIHLTKTKIRKRDLT